MKRKMIYAVVPEADAVRMPDGHLYVKSEGVEVHSFGAHSDKLPAHYRVTYTDNGKAYALLATVGALIPIQPLPPTMEVHDG